MYSFPDRSSHLALLSEDGGGIGKAIETGPPCVHFQYVLLRLGDLGACVRVMSYDPSPLIAQVMLQQTLRGFLRCLGRPFFHRSLVVVVMALTIMMARRSCSLALSAA